MEDHMKKIIILIALLFVTVLVFAQMPSAMSITQSTDGTYEIEYTVPYGPRFSINAVTNYRKSIGDVALEQIPNIESLTPVLVIYKTNDAIPGTIDMESRKITFSGIQASAITGNVWNIAFFGTDNNYWLHGLKYKGKDSKHRGFRF